MELSPETNINGDENIPNRRKSGRAVKAPEYLSPSGPPSGGKRKRATAINRDDEDAMDQSSGDDQEDDSGPDEDEEAEQRREAKKASRSKATSKRARIDGASTALPMRPAANKPKASRKAAPNAAATAVGGLYAEVFAGRDVLDDVATRWLQRFDEDESAALTEMVNFILRCSGCNLKVDVHDIEDPDNCASRLEDIQAEFQAQSITEYPLVAKGKSAATFKDNLSGFFSCLMKALASTELLFSNPLLLENIQVWVSAMTSAAFPPFRHTSTIISLAIISGLSETGRNLTENRAVTLRQGEGEKKKSKVNKKRVSDLQQAAKQAAERGAEMNNIIKDWFDTVFVHRYRDKEPKIRVECVSYLGSWIMTYPEQFFDGEHLRYLGWLLSDDNATTRLETVKQLQILYGDPNKTVGLRQFTERFRPRMVEMAARDAELNIRCSSIELVDILRESELLEPNDIDVVGRLIYDREVRVRKSVAPFFVASVEETVSVKVDELGGQDSLDESLPAVNDDDFEQARPAWLTLKAVAELLRSFEPESRTPPGLATANDLTELDKSGVESRTSLAARAFIDNIAVLKQWELVAGCLLFDHSESTSSTTKNDALKQLEEQCNLDEKEEVILLDILNVSVEEALNEVVSETGNKRTKKSKAQLREIREAQEEAAQKLMTYIPKLMNKFGASPTAASTVLRFLRVLNSKIFEEFRHDSTTFASFLDDINRQFLTHQDAGVLAAARDALLRASTADDLKEVAEGKVQELWEDTIHTLVSSCRGDEMSDRGSISEPFLTRIAQSVLRISNLASISNCTEILDTPKQLKINEPRRKKREQPAPVVPITVLIEAICRGIPSSQLDPESDSLEDAIATNAAQSVLFYFMWHHNSIESAVEAGKAPDGLDLTKYIDLAEAASTNLSRVIAARRGPDTLRVNVAGILLDLYVILHGSERAMKRLQDQQGIESEEQWPRLHNSAQSDILKVFVGLEYDYAKKSGKFLEPPADDDDPNDSSDDDDDDEDEEADDADEEASQRRREKVERKQAATILAERTLCHLAGRMGIAITVGVLDRQTLPSSDQQQPNGTGEGPIKQRLFRNRAKLGHDFREICKALDKPMKSTAARRKGAAKSRAGAKNAANAKAKSNTLIIDEDDEEDDAEAGEDEQMGDEAEDAVVQDEDEDEAMEREDAATESVIGD